MKASMKIKKCSSAKGGAIGKEKYEELLTCHLFVKKYIDITIANSINCSYLCKFLHISDNHCCLFGKQIKGGVLTSLFIRCPECVNHFN